MTQPADLELNKASATSALPPAARQLHRHILQTSAETGHGPSRAQLDDYAREHALDPGATVDELTRRDVVVLDAHGELRAAYPFSQHPTRITVAWAGGPTAYAMCAVDALGVSAMLGRPVVITATEPGTGEVVIVDVDDDRATWIPDTAVVYAGSTDDDCCPSADRTCGNINFFTTRAAAEAWANKHPEVAGGVLDQQTALASGIAEFGEMMPRQRL